MDSSQTGHDGSTEATTPPSADSPKPPPTTADPDLTNITERGREPGAGVYGKVFREK
jgi:hypothetical protein